MGRGSRERERETEKRGPTVFPFSLSCTETTCATTATVPAAAAAPKGEREREKRNTLRIGGNGKQGRGLVSHSLAEGAENRPKIYRASDVLNVLTVFDDRIASAGERASAAGTPRKQPSLADAGRLGLASAAGSRLVRYGSTYAYVCACFRHSASAFKVEIVQSIPCVRLQKGKRKGGVGLLLALITSVEDELVEREVGFETAGQATGSRETQGSMRCNCGR